jgi:hypothetical protein
MSAVRSSALMSGRWKGQILEGESIRKHTIQIKINGPPLIMACQKFLASPETMLAMEASHLFSKELKVDIVSYQED